MLVINDLSFSFENFEVLRHFSLQLALGEIGTLIGSSGSGKTTVFKLLTGILKGGEGMLSIAGKSPPEAHKHVAYMMQEDLLLPWRTILDNLVLVGELGKKKTQPLGNTAGSQILSQ